MFATELIPLLTDRHGTLGLIILPEYSPVAFDGLNPSVDVAPDMAGAAKLVHYTPDEADEYDGNRAEEG